MTGQSHSRLVSLLGAVSAGAAIGVFGIGSLVLVGWTFDLAVLRSFDPGLTSMKANTAVAFMLTGISLWLSQAKRTRFRLGRCVAWGSASLVAVLGLLTLVEYVSGWNLGIDQLLFAELSGAVQTIDPGRMAPNTALNFLLIGLALLLLDVQTRRGHRPAQYLIGLEGIIATVALVGYVYGTSALYSPSPAANPMSVPAVLAGVVAFVGLWLARPGPALLALLEGEQAGSMMVRRVLLPLLLAPLLVDMAVLAGQRAGLYGEPLAAAAHVVLMIAILLGLVLAAAAPLNRAQAELAALRSAPGGPSYPSVLTPGGLGRRRLRYLAAVVVVAAAALVRLGFLQALGKRVTFVTFYPAVMLAALYGGLAAGLLATILSAGLAAYFWMEPSGFAIQDPADWLAMTIFLMSGTMISGVTEAMHRAQARAREAELQAGLAAAGRREAEVLRASEEWLATVLRTSPAGIFVTREADGLFLEANEAYLKLIGYPAEEVIGHKSLELKIWVDPEDRQKLVDALRRHGHIENSEIRFRRKTGEVVNLLYSARSFEQAGERRILGALMDITERKRAAEVLREREATLSGILKATKESIWLFSPEGVIRMGNEMATSRFGEGGERVIGKHFAEILPPALAQSRLAKLGEVVASGRPMESEDERAGMIFHHDWYPIVDGAGRVTSVACFSRDVTERKRAGEALRKAHDELEKRVKERTAELAHTVETLEDEVRQRQLADENIRKQASLLDLAHDAILVRDMNSRIVFWSKGAFETYGYTQEEATGYVTHELLKAEFPKPLEEIRLDVINTGHWEGELIHTRRDGARVTVASRWAIQRDKGGNPSAIMEINRDITARKEAEEAIKTERQRFFDLLEMMPAYALLLTPDYHVAYANRTFRDWFGDDHGEKML
jgi:PAS domain S-box-containing protein